MESPANDLSLRADEELMALVGRGEDGAFRELLERHSDRVRGTIFRMLPAGAEVDDLAQDVFLRVWKAAPRYRPTAKFTTWLLTITRNVIFNETRKRRRAAFVPMDAAEPSEEARRLAGPADEHPDRIAEAEEIRREVDLALRELPEKQRLALVLHRFEGLPHEEIARILGTSVPSVKSLIFRARETLRVRLASLLEAAG